MWSQADAAFNPIDLEVPQEFLAANPNMAFDFTDTYTRSDLDVSRVEIGLSVRYEASDLLAFWGGYRHLEYQDDAPYLYDTTGEVNFYSIGLGWTF